MVQGKKKKKKNKKMKITSKTGTAKRKNCLLADKKA